MSDAKPLTMEGVNRALRDERCSPLFGDEVRATVEELERLRAAADAMEAELDVARTYLRERCKASVLKLFLRPDVRLLPVHGRDAEAAMSDATFHLVARASILASGDSDDFGHVAADEVVLVEAGALERVTRERDEARADAARLAKEVELLKKSRLEHSSLCEGSIGRACDLPTVCDPLRARVAELEALVSLLQSAKEQAEHAHNELALSLSARSRELEEAVSFDLKDECPTCRAKPGSPTLCAECLERRALRAEVERVEAEAASYRRALVAVRDALKATDQEPDGENDPRRPLASLVWRVLKEKDAGAGLLAEVERLRGLIAEAEYADHSPDGNSCPWCGVVARGQRYSFQREDPDHAPNCPAFSARGEVRR